MAATYCLWELSAVSQAMTLSWVDKEWFLAVMFDDKRCFTGKGKNLDELVLNAGTKYYTEGIPQPLRTD